MRRPDESDPVAAVRFTVATALAAGIPAGAPIAIALSGGRDSVVLLDALVAVATQQRHPLRAAHVHHGLSTNADAWQRFCAQLCEERGVPLSTGHVIVARGAPTGVEAEARRLRYAALAEAATAAGIEIIALAHHRDDQAETLILQLLRGAGPQGMAGMPAMRRDPRGILWWRPLLGVTRSTIDAYAAAAGLGWVDDESNEQHRHLRNAVRHRVMPALAAVSGNAAATLARAAAHQAEAALLADDLARFDAQEVVEGNALIGAALAALPGHRARNVLRWFLRERGLPAPSTARLAAMVEQLCTARGDAAIRLVHAGVELGVHRGRVLLHGPPPPWFDVPWRGEPALELAHGRLVFGQASGTGLDAERLTLAPVRVRARAGGERFQSAPERPRRALKAILREAGIPVWDRAALPLVFCGDRLVAVSGVGIDAGFRAPPGKPGFTLSWHPRQY
jgi:tRNA(Ile)-lysidine synthase